MAGAEFKIVPVWEGNGEGLVYTELMAQCAGLHVSQRRKGVARFPCLRRSKKSLERLRGGDPSKALPGICRLVCLPKVGANRGSTGRGVQGVHMRVWFPRRRLPRACVALAASKPAAVRGNACVSQFSASFPKSTTHSPPPPTLPIHRSTPKQRHHTRPSTAGK